MELNRAGRAIRTTILYYGPPLGGKTTNLQVLHRLAVGARRGELISVNTMQDRTLLCDLLPLKSSGFRGYDLQVRLMAVPGQAMYAASRRVALRTADAVVFVANSAHDRLPENIQSLREMKDAIVSAGNQPMPTVMQYNKRDLPDVTAVADLDHALGVPSGLAIPAVATDGQGLLETLGAALVQMLGRLSARHPVLALTPGETIEQWVRRMLREVFGQEACPLPPPPREAPIRVGAARPDDGACTLPGGPTLEARLAERYAEAAWKLSVELSDARAERDRSERRLQDIRDALAATQALHAGRPLGATLQPFLSRMAEAGDAAAGAFIVPAADSALKVVALTALAGDPLAAVSARGRAALTALLRDDGPEVLEHDRHSAVREMLDAAGFHDGALLAVPFRTARGLQGLAVLYYGQDQSRPGARMLAHLGHMAAAVTPSLELRRALAGRRTDACAAEAVLGGPATLPA